MQDYLASLHGGKKQRRGCRRKYVSARELVPAVETQRQRTPSAWVSDETPIAQTATLPQVPIVTDQSLVSALDDAKTVMLVTRRVEADNRPDVAAAADEALWKPSFTALVAHNSRMLPNARTQPRRAEDSSQPAASRQIRTAFRRWLQ